MLEGKIVKKRGHFMIETSFRCEKGNLLAVTGPSGAGKTTIIRMLAGLEKPGRGKIINDGVAWYDSEKNIWMPPRERRVGYVFQEHSLFPHLNIAENVGFSCSEKLRVNDLLELFGISHLASRMPNQVSGGERQRTAFAQALASSPDVLLLDEPFSALDKMTRTRLRYELKKLKKKLSIPIVMVTHDNEEANFLGDTKLNLDSCERKIALNLTEKTSLSPSGIFQPLKEAFR